jgi:glycogen operon protein
LPELAKRIAGSADLFGHNGRLAADSVNFITCHDGFTLHDLVAYNGKHNEANHEDNRDGLNDNDSWNCGAEGETGDPDVLELRGRQVRNLLCHLFFSLGTPMLSAGDEFLRTQRGNNNAYAQDNDLAWLDWSYLGKNAEMFRFVKMAIAFRASHGILRRQEFLMGEEDSGDRIPDVTWIAPDGQELDWEDAEQRCLGCMVDGAECDDEAGAQCDYALFIIYNADFNGHEFHLPPLTEDKVWFRIVDTGLPPGEDFKHEVEAQPIEEASYRASPRTSVVLIGKARK